MKASLAGRQKSQIGRRAAANFNRFSGDPFSEPNGVVHPGSACDIAPTHTATVAERRATAMGSAQLLAVA
jgi:hypothetical protein